MPRILIVEDNIQYQGLLHKRLLTEGYSVSTANNGKVALEIVKKEQIDLILLDLLMPEVDGVTFYYQLENILKKHLPIIILTNITTATAYNQDVKEVIVKSNVSLDEVVEKVKKYLH